MEALNFQNILSSRREQKELVSFLNDKSCKRALLEGLYASSKAYAVGDAVLSYGKGIHVVVLPNKEEAQFFTNDLYNIVGEESVFYFPTSSHQVSKISTIKESSQKVQRSAAISALTAFNDSASKKGFIIIVTYPGAIYEKILNSRSLKENILKISVNDSLSHEFIKETLFAYNFEKVDL